MSDNYNGHQGGQQFGGPQGPQYNSTQPGMNPQGGQSGMNPQSGQFGTGPQSPQFSQGQPQFNPGHPGMNPQSGQPGRNPQGGQQVMNPQGGQPVMNPQGGQPVMNPQGGQPGMNPQGGQFGAGPQSPQFNQGRPQFNTSQPGMNPQQPKRPQSGPSMQYHGDSDNASQIPNYVNPQFNPGQPGQPGRPGQPDLQKPQDNKTLFIVIGIAAAVVITLLIVIGVMFSKGKGRDNDVVTTSEVTTEDVDTTEPDSDTQEQPDSTEPDDTEAATEATTEEASSASSGTATPVEGLSDNLSDFTFSLNGVIYQLPCDYKTFADNGWTVDTSYTTTTEDTEMSATTYSSISLTNGSNVISVYVYNPSGDTKTIKDCKIGQIEVEAKDGVDFQVAKGITPSSSRDDVIAAFGEPKSNDKGDGYEYLNYEFDENTFYEKVTFYYSDTGDGEYNSIVVENMQISEEDKSEASTDIPDYLSTYVAPKELGSDTEAPVFQLDGKLYRLPCPLKEFTDDGWEVSEVNVESVGSGNMEYSALTISKGGMELSLGMYNFTKVSTITQNCAVASVSLEYMYSESLGEEIELPKDSVVCPNGIKFGTSRDDLKKALSSNYEEYKSDDSDYYSYSYDGDDISISYTISSTEDYNTFEISMKNRNWDY